MYVYMYMHMCIVVHMCIYIYVYLRLRNRCIDKNTPKYMYMLCYLDTYTYICIFT